MFNAHLGIQSICIIQSKKSQIFTDSITEPKLP